MGETPVAVSNGRRRAVAAAERAMASDRADTVVVAVAALAWLALPFTLGAAVDDALGGSQLSSAVVSAWSGLLWVGWAVGVLALAVPRSASLTALRLVGPAPVIAAAVAAAYDGADIIAALVAAVATIGVFAPAVGQRAVQGSAYGDERRFPLRVPPALLLGPLPLAWVLFSAGIAGPMVAFAAGQWALGAAATVVGASIAVVVVRAAHGLSRRWLVFVPAGFVVHDGYALAEPVLFSRPLIAVLHPAPADSDALDLTGGASGLALELELAESVPMTLAAGGWRRRQPGDSGRVSRLLVTPTRPGRVLTTAAARRIPVS